MSVIINELEVVVEAPAAPPGPAAAPAPQAAPPLRPLDIADILERQGRSEWRLMAH